MGNIFFAQGEYEKAEELFNLGVKYDPDHEGCIRGIETLVKNAIKLKLRKAVQKAREVS